MEIDIPKATVIEVDSMKDVLKISKDRDLIFETMTPYLKFLIEHQKSEFPSIEEIFCIRYKQRETGETLVSVSTSPDDIKKVLKKHMAWLIRSEQYEKCGKIQELLDSA
ncbi:MAG TPA: hypothetical protein P5509_01635 [Bacteroidales bacterium]|nr:hypothetical protein [Bacteroidales bacterium]